MKFPSIEVLQLVGTRLGFGSLKPGAAIADEPACSENDLEQEPRQAEYPAAPPPDPNWLNARPLPAHEELAFEFGKQKPQPRESNPPSDSGVQGSRNDVGQLLAQLSFSATFHETAPAPALVPQPPPLPAKAPKQHAVAAQRSCRALVVGFPTGQRTRFQQVLSQHFAGGTEFLSLESLPERKHEAAASDLLVVNIASVIVVQRNRQEFLDLIATGRPVLLTGSRVAMKQLGMDPEENANWDFQPVPWDPDEMIWRAKKLLQKSPPPSPQPLPLPEPPAMHAVENASATAAPAVSIKQIVIADHDPITRSLVESTLSLPGMVSVHVTEDGEAALERVREHRPDVLVMDLSLPNRDGFQLLAEVKRSKDLRKTRVVVLTARQTEVDILRAFGLGADDYVTKPFSPLELRARVQRLIARGPAE